MQPVLITSRLILRPFTLTDADDVQRMAGDARVAATTTAIPHPYPDDAGQAWISMHATLYEEGKEIIFAICLRSSGALVGVVSLLDIARIHARAELGYWFGVEYWSHGYCTEAVRRLIHFAIEELRTTRIVARCLEKNKASARVMEKCGLKREGRLPKHVLKDGKFEDVLLYGLLLQERP